MFNNYLKIVYRNIIRHPSYAILNLSSLTLGIAASLLILLYLNFELGYDQFHERAENTYRIETPTIVLKNTTRDVNWRATPASLSPLMKKDFPEVESTARIFYFYRNSEIQFETENKITISEHVAAADPGLLDIFTFDFIYGGDKSALDGPNKIIINESLAKKIFGNTDPVGEVLNTELTLLRPEDDPNYAFQITGVYRDFPENSHIRLNALFSAESDPRYSDYGFNRFAYYTYTILKEGVSPEKFAEKLPSIYTKYLDPEVEPTLKSAKHRLVPLTDIHIEIAGGYQYIYIFGAIGFLILLIAVISYVNLVTAQASKRAMEIGVRKVMGSSRTQLMTQFFSESQFFSFIATIFAIILVAISIYPLNEVLDLQLSLRQLIHPKVLLGILGMLIGLGILGGSYPAFFLSSFQPITIIKSKLARGMFLRKTLVAVQFAVVIFVLISTGMIYYQLNFLQQKDLGFNREQVVRLDFPSDEKPEKITILKSELQRSPLISSIGNASFLPGISMPRRPLSADNSADRASQFVHYGSIDQDFFESMDIPIVAGRNFSSEHPDEGTQNIIVNKTLAKQFGLANPIGEKVRFGDKDNPNFVRIVGVIEDFHQYSLHEPIAAQMFLFQPNNHHLMVKIDKNISDGMQDIEKTWNKLFPNTEFSFTFLDEDIKEIYRTDEVRGKIFMLFSILTILIAFLGLFGLASYTTSQRVKEIGIRKVLGAELMDIVLLISKDFLLLVSIAAVPAFLIGWYFINQWLQNFAYHTSINYILFAFVLLFILVLTLLVTGMHALRATRVNPAESLKYE